jgi:hypothetical protein
MERIYQFDSVQKESRDIFIKKNTDYGDSFASYGPVGVIIRLSDKISRLKNITKTSVTLVDDETIRDTLIDLHNYSAMAIMLLEENK